MSLLVIALAVYLAGSLISNSEKWQWDFRTYYYAAKLHGTGANPYDTAVVRNLADQPMHPYLYPPLALRLFQPLSHWSFKTASYVWLGFKFLFLVPLIWIWRKYFVAGPIRWPFYLLAILAFGSPLYLDLKAGNVAMIEQLLLWLGFVFLLKDKPLWFCVLVVMASLFKGLILVFLLLLLVFKIPRRWWYMVGSGVAFGIVQLIDYLAHPDLYSTFLQQSLTWDERGANFNPSTYAMAKDIVQPLSEKGFSEATVAAWALVFYGVVIVTVLALTWRHVRPKLAGGTNNSSADQTAQMTVVILLFCLLFALLMPRFKVYSFMMVLPSVYYVIRTNGARAALIAWFVLLTISPHSHLPFDNRFLTGLGFYLPMLTLYFVWGVWMAGEGETRNMSLRVPHFRGRSNP